MVASLKLFNTLTKKKEEFTPQELGRVKIYNCGPTVYDYPHIGNLRRYIASDILRRYLEFSGYEVRDVTNITDVGHLTEDELDRGEDKIIAKAKKEKKSPYDLARKYTKAFLEDIKALHIRKAHFYPKATKHIQEMQEIIKVLLKKGYAYETKDGVYFSVEKFKDYGKLSGNTPAKIKKGARIEPSPYKKHPADFALWIKAHPQHLMQWESPWGKGYPGWHIECSAMSMKYLGETLDIHTGGEDNIFPHHENEIAQSEAVTGKPFVRFWMHSRHLLVEGRKMAKRDGTFYRLKDLADKGFSPLAFRLLVLQSHYRSKLNFTWKSMQQAQNSYQALLEWIRRLNNIQTKGEKNKKIKSQIDKTKEKFIQALNDDLNTPSALASVFKLMSVTNSRIDQGKLNQKDAENILKFLKKIDKVLAIFVNIFLPKITIPHDVQNLIAEREKARRERNFKKADFFRNEINKLGFDIEDTKEGPKVKKI